jgi:hypothetical protein
MHLRTVAAVQAAMMAFAFTSEFFAGGEWPDGPNKSSF